CRWVVLTPEIRRRTFNPVHHLVGSTQRHVRSRKVEASTPGAAPILLTIKCLSRGVEGRARLIQMALPELCSSQAKLSLWRRFASVSFLVPVCRFRPGCHCQRLLCCSVRIMSCTRAITSCSIMGA